MGISGFWNPVLRYESRVFSAGVTILGLNTDSSRHMSMHIRERMRSSLPVSLKQALRLKIMQLLSLAGRPPGKCEKLSRRPRELPVWLVTNEFIVDYHFNG